VSRPKSRLLTVSHLVADQHGRRGSASPRHCRVPSYTTRHGDFYAIERHGFPKANWKDYEPSPQQFQPEYLASPDFRTKGYYYGELNDGVYWVTNGGYDAAFVRTGSGVIAIDAPPSLGENMLAACTPRPLDRYRAMEMPFWLP